MSIPDDKPRARRTHYGWRVTKYAGSRFALGVGTTLEAAYADYMFAVDYFKPFGERSTVRAWPAEFVSDLGGTYTPHPWYKQLYYTVRYSEWICKFLRR
ncbi:MAG: hypothetical protein [Bacteriophage sp.]|nr:MAG: hypothetical protein [Bacteriophage sp.]